MPALEVRNDARDIIYRFVTINLDPTFLFPPVEIFGSPGSYISEEYGPPCMLSTIAEIQKGQGLDSGYEWLAGLVSRVCMGDPNIPVVQNIT